MDENEQNLGNENTENVVGNQEENGIVENNVVNTIEGDTNEITLQDVQEMEEEKLEEYSGLGESFLVSLFVLVLISMIFESAIKILRNRVYDKEADKADATVEKKWLLGTIIVFLVFLIIFSIIASVHLHFPIEVIIAFDVASFWIVMVSNFFRWRMIWDFFTKKKDKGGDK